MTRYDVEHSLTEERWVTLGQVGTGQLVVVIHTFEELAAEARIRIMSDGSMRAAEVFTLYEVTVMRDEYDFSNAERGKFHRKNAVLQLPVYLDPEVREYLAARAKAKGIEVDQLVDELLRRDIELIEAAK